jgi:hypothetical protein
VPGPSRGTPSAPTLSDLDGPSLDVAGGEGAATPQSVPVGPADRTAATPGLIGPFDFVSSVLTGAAGTVGLILRPEAALAVATEFTFPLVLALAVLMFLVIQDQFDRRDPKLRAAPQHATDTFIRFELEEEL